MVPDQPVQEFLASHGISGHELAEALRAVFSKIAASFSPHSSIKIRRVQVEEILERCVIPGLDRKSLTAGPVYGSSSNSGNSSAHPSSSLLAMNRNKPSNSSNLNLLQPK